MRESLSFNFERDPAPPEDPVDGVKKYVATHREEPEFAATEKTPFWSLEDALPAFETYCNRLRAEGSIELRRSRELTLVLDKATYSGGHAKITEPHEITALLLPDIAERFKEAPYQDSREKLEAEVQRAEEMKALNDFEAASRKPQTMGPGEIEPVLALLEGRVAWLDYEIDRESRTPNKNPRDERNRRAAIKELENKRKGFRRARIYLLDKYFA